jgi:hypothetical protein
MRQSFHVIRLPCHGYILDRFLPVGKSFPGDNNEMDGQLPHFVESFPQLWSPVKYVCRFHACR